MAITRCLTFVTLALSTLLACLEDGDPTDPELGTDPQELASGKYFVRNLDATHARRCLELTGVTGARVTAEICSSKREHQGISHDGSKRLVGQTTGPAKCLAVVAPNLVVMQPCATGVVAQQWTRLAPLAGTSSAPYKSDLTGTCLTLRAGGAVVMAPCVGAPAQGWRIGVEVTLIDTMQNGRLTQPMADPTGLVNEVVVPASDVTKAATEGNIDRWSIFPIYVDVVGFRALGYYAIGRDAWGAPRTFFKSLRTWYRSDLDDMRLVMTALMNSTGTSYYQRDTLVTNNVIATHTPASFAEHLPISTANALLVEDLRRVPAPRAATTALTDLVYRDHLSSTAILEVGATVVGAGIAAGLLMPSSAIIVAVAGGLDALIQNNPTHGRLPDPNHPTPPVPAQPTDGTPQCGYTQLAERAGNASRCDDWFPANCMQGSASCLANPATCTTTRPWSCGIQKRQVRQHVYEAAPYWRACSDNPGRPPAIDLTCVVTARHTNENGSDSCHFRCTQSYVICGYSYCQRRL